MFSSLKNGHTDVKPINSFKNNKIYGKLKKIPFADSEGNVMFPGVIQLSNDNSIIKNPLRCYLIFLLNFLNKLEINNPLYYLTLPGLILGTTGLYMILNSVKDIYFDGSFNLENTILVILLTLVGTIVAYTGILLHFIAGLVKYKENKF